MVAEQCGSTGICKPVTRITATVTYTEWLAATNKEKEMDTKAMSEAIVTIINGITEEITIENVDIVNAALSNMHSKAAQVAHNKERKGALMLVPVWRNGATTMTQIDGKEHICDFGYSNLIPDPPMDGVMYVYVDKLDAKHPKSGTIRNKPKEFPIAYLVVFSIG